jgi:hypothetical protein
MLKEILCCVFRFEKNPEWCCPEELLLVVHGIIQRTFVLAPQRPFRVQSETENIKELTRAKVK